MSWISGTVPPRATDGIPTGVDDWRIAVQAILPTQYGALVGSAVVGRTAVAEPTWLDLPGVASVSITRGAQQFGVQRDVGTATISLVSKDHRWSQWMRSAAFWGSGARFRPGLGVRVVVFDPVAPVNFQALFTGEVERWRTIGQQADVFEIAEIHCMETFGRLGWSRLEEFYVPDDDKSGTSFGAPRAQAGDVLNRIVDQVNWPWGFNYYNATSHAFSPNLAAVVDSDPTTDRYTGSALKCARINAYAEYLGIHSDRFGVLETRLLRPLAANGRYVVNSLTDDAQGLTSVALTEDDIQPESLVVVTSPDAVVNARNAEGLYSWATEDYRVEGSINWVGLRYANDVPTGSLFSINPDSSSPWTDEQELQAIRTEVDFRAYLVEQIEPIRFTNRRFDLLNLGVDIGSEFTLSCEMPNASRTLEASGEVRSISYSITPRHDAAINWETTLTLDTYSLEGA